MSINLSDRIALSNAQNSDDLPNLPILDKITPYTKGQVGEDELCSVVVNRHLQVGQNEEGKTGEIRDVEMLTSRWIDREPPEGSWVHLSDGYFCVKRNFIDGGAFVSVLEPEDKNSPWKIVCRGTAGRVSANGGFDSVMNDVLHDVGMRGVEAIWQDLKTFLNDEGIDSVEVLGKSMGGAQAQMLATLIHNKIDNTNVTALKTLAAVSVSEQVRQNFHGIPVLIIRTVDDYIPTVGGHHVQCDGNTRIRYISLEYRDNPRLERDISILTLAWRFFRSFSGPHKQQTTLGNFHIHEINAQEIEEELAIGALFDGMRQRLARFFALFVTQTRFESFYDTA